MKRAIIAVIVTFATATMSNAQVLLGGNFGLDLTGGKDENFWTAGGIHSNLEKSSTISFSFSPRVGFYLNDNFALGLQVGFNYWNRTTPKMRLGAIDDLIETSFGWQVGTFVRHNVLKVNNFSILLEGSLGIGGAQSKSEQGTVINGNPISTFSVSMIPVLSYSLKDWLSIESNLDFLKLGFLSVTEKNADDKSIKSTDNSFGFSFNNGTNSIISDILNISLIFKF